jgi:hypothetical protein
MLEYGPYMNNLRQRILTPAQYNATKKRIEHIYRIGCAKAQRTSYVLWPEISQFGQNSFTRRELMASARLEPRTLNRINSQLRLLVARGLLEIVRDSSPPRSRRPTKTPSRPCDIAKYKAVSSDDLARDYLRGVDTVSLGAMYGMDPSAVADRLHKAGVQLRPSGLAAHRYRVVYDAKTALAKVAHDRDVALRTLEREWTRSRFFSLQETEISGLPSEERYVLARRIAGWSYGKIGQQLKVSRQRVEQIQREAFELLDA